VADRLTGRSENLQLIEAGGRRPVRARGVQIEQRGAGDVVVALQVAPRAGGVNAPAECLDVRGQIVFEAARGGDTVAVHPARLLGLVLTVGPDDLMQTQVRGGEFRVPLSRN